MKAPSTTASDFDSCRAGSASARSSALSLPASALVSAACLLLLAIGLILLGTASDAQASSGVLGFESEPSESNGVAAPLGVALNTTGNGGVPAGTNYVAEEGNGRTSQFSTTGKLVRAFGDDVVQSGPDNSVLKQRIRVNATAGTYKLELHEVSVALGHLTNGSNQITELNIFFGAFRVGDGIEGVGIPAGATITEVAGNTAKLSSPATKTGEPYLYVNEATGDIAATSSAASVEAALNALPANSAAGGSTVSGGPGDAGATNPYIVTRGLRFNIATGSTPLSGGTATAEAGVINQGTYGYEVCNPNPPSSDVCKYGFGSQLRGLAVNQETGDVYVARSGQIVEYSATGDFIRAFGGNMVRSGPSDVTPANAKQAVDIPSSVSGGTFSLGFGGATTGPIPFNASPAVVESELAGLPSIGAGNVEVSGGNGTVAPFAVTFVGTLARNAEPLIEIDSTNLTGGTGTVAELQAGASEFEVCGQIDTCENGGFGNPIGGAITSERPYGMLAVVPAGAPGAGNVLLAEVRNHRVQEFAPDGAFIKAFGFDVVAAGPHDRGVGKFEECRFGDACQPGSTGSAIGQFGQGGPNDVAVDSTGAVYTVDSKANYRVQKFTRQAGPEELSPAVFGAAEAPNGSSTASTPTNVAIGPEDHVLVAKSFPAGATGSCPGGAPSKAESRIQELSTDGATLLDTHMVCNGVSIVAFTANTVTGTLMVVPDRPTDSFEPARRVYYVGPTGPPALSLDSVSDETTTGAKITGTVNPGTVPFFAHFPHTSYHLEYKLSTASSWSQYVPDVDVGAGTSDIPISIFIAGLDANRTYEARLVARKDYGTGETVTPPQTFSTLPAAPRIESTWTSDVTASSADIHIEVNPFGQDSTYRIEYGPTTQYGSTAPVPDGSIAASPDPQSRTIHLAGLLGRTYHFRVVAENSAGVSVGGDQTFNFYPPDCPNARIRAQTGASFLPDCRAYELVSPARAGNVTLVPEGPFAPSASSPARFAFAGRNGYLEGTGEPQGQVRDVYVATRHPDGWVTKYVGLPADQSIETTGLPREGEEEHEMWASLSLDRVVAFDGSDGGSYAPYLRSTDGVPIRRLPTNVSEVVGAERYVSEGGFTGSATISPDFSHYFFSTKDLSFAPGGQTVVPGSAYDNDLATGEVTVISKTPLGADIPQDPVYGPSHPDEVIKFPGASTDGSHVLMSTNGPGGTVHLYMAVDDVHHYDVSVGQDGINHSVTYVGMTADGSRAYFASPEQLTADDNDSSSDIFMWQDGATPSVVRVSSGDEGSGNGDGCSAGWIKGCSAVPIKTQSRSDNALAATSGDLYFLSPEQLESGKGVPGEMNLYRYHGGAVHFVATLVGSSGVRRIQVSPDGSHLALVTADRLTTKPTAGHLMMYSIDPATGSIQCVSCDPTGTLPTVDVSASRNGLFMSDDGRTAFATSDSLVPQDTNGLLDTYEFVDSKAQLISSGTATRVYETGFVGFSADGIDLYFMTRYTHAGQDQVGPFVKFYDARTGGGIPFEPPVVPCAAADECHGPSSAPPSDIESGSSAALGAGGNAKSKKSGGKKKKHHRKGKSRKVTHRHGKAHTHKRGTRR